MASIISGYEYDIFISYRQKDNKYDGWVTEFVSNLKKELEATFKEEISVYFDINPHDGLLETHDVDASLKKKLNCLIFIPVISQTYCDSKSFAWNHEFVAFHNMAKEDLFGINITLTNGNIASRILPVKIHEIDIADQKVFEDEVGGVMRAIEFIYKEPGVNRPLNPDDDSIENLNRTKYRNQVNKVANAIKDIITGLKNYDQPADKDVVVAFTEKTEPLRKKRKTKLIVWSLVALAFFAIGYYSITRLLKSSGSIEKSIAVLPFVSFSDDVEQEYFSDAMLDEILDRLCKVGDLQVSSRTSSMSYKNTSLPLKRIGEELGVSNIVEGSVRKINDRVRIIVQLVDAKKDEHIWSETYDRDYADIFNLTSEIAETIAMELKAVITAQEQKLIDKVPTDNMQAYEDYIVGRHLWNQQNTTSILNSIVYLNKSIDLDPDFAEAYVALADAYISMNKLIPNFEEKQRYRDSSRVAVERAIQIDENLSAAYITYGEVLGKFDWNWNAMKNMAEKGLELNPNNSYGHILMSDYYLISGQLQKSIEESLLAEKLDPINPITGCHVAERYLAAGRYNESINQYNKVLQLFPNYGYAWDGIGYAHFHTGNRDEAIKSWQKLHSIIGNDSLAIYYGTATFEESLLYWLTQARGPSPQYCSNPTVVATVYMMLSDNSNALDYLEAAFENHDEELPLMLFRRDFFPLHDDPRFKDLVSELDISLNI